MSSEELGYLVAKKVIDKKKKKKKKKKQRKKKERKKSHDGVSYSCGLYAYGGMCDKHILRGDPFDGKIAVNALLRQSSRATGVTMVSVGSIVIGKRSYRLRRVLACGALGCVGEYVSDDGYHIAIKNGVVDDDARAIKEIDGACSKMLVRGRVIQTSSRVHGKHQHIVMQYMDGDLFSLLASGNLPDRRVALEICAAVCRALVCLLSRGLFYLDIKPENVMFMCDGSRVFSIMLADIGSATKSKKGVICTYRSPERDGRSRGVDDPTRQDIVWAVGLLYLALLDPMATRKYERTNLPRLTKRELESDIDNDPRVLRGMLDVRPHKRMSLLRAHDTFVREAILEEKEAEIDTRRRHK